MEDKKKQAQTPEETARELSELAEELAEMDRAEGAFGESMADALTDEYLEEVVGGLAPLAVTTPGCDTKLCDVCLNKSDRPPI